MSRPFIAGLDLSEALYEEAVRPLLVEHFPGLAYSAALVGPGSEVLGFDTEQSADHNWGPRLLVFLSDADLAAYGELVFSYYDSGFVHCLEATSGKQLWFKRLTSGFSGSPVRVRDKLYCIDDEGTVIVLAADREFRELARNPLGERSRSTPAVSGGRMFLRTESQLFCVGGVARKVAPHSVR